MRRERRGRGSMGTKETSSGVGREGIVIVLLLPLRCIVLSADEERESHFE